MGGLMSTPAVPVQTSESEVQEQVEELQKNSHTETVTEPIDPKNYVSGESSSINPEDDFIKCKIMDDDHSCGEHKGCSTANNLEADTSTKIETVEDNKIDEPEMLESNVNQMENVESKVEEFTNTMEKETEEKQDEEEHLKLEEKIEEDEEKQDAEEALNTKEIIEDQVENIDCEKSKIEELTNDKGRKNEDKQEEEKGLKSDEEIEDKQEEEETLKSDEEIEDKQQEEEALKSDEEIEDKDDDSESSDKEENEENEENVATNNITANSKRRQFKSIRNKNRFPSKKHCGAKKTPIRAPMTRARSKGALVQKSL